MSSAEISVRRSAQGSSFRSAVLGWLRRKMSARIPCPSEVAFAVAVSGIWLVLYNVRFWQLTAAAMWHPTFGAALFFVSVVILILSAQALLLLLMPTQRLLRIAASVLFLVAAASAYFISAYGALMDRDMMRNVFETDPAEVSGLLNLDLTGHLLLLGVVPALLVWRVALPERTWSKQLGQRLAFVASAVALSMAGVFASSSYYAVFLREHKPIRFTITPTAPVSSSIGLFAKVLHGAEQGPLVDPGGAVTRTSAIHAKPLVIFLVVGETARAANFQLGGYARPTNTELAKIDGLTYFNNATSCATATAASVPCMFSHFGREQFEVGAANRYTNLLDVFAAAGFDVEWRDNNAGCKGVCARVRQISYADRPDPALCPNGYCFDAVMLTDLDARLRQIERDTLIVFHQIGSHGPAYSERYPPAFERFKPACHTNELNKCSAQEIVNAYDNSIAYTDHVLARQIAQLQAADAHVDSLLIYMSDHGESLGEQGVYLHGLPYRFAPRQQKEVPFVLWASPGFSERSQLDSGCLRMRVRESFSHDNLYHTAMGAADVRNAVYQSTLDALAPCRAHGRAPNAE